MSHDQENCPFDELHVSHLCFAIAATTSGLHRSSTRISIMEDVEDAAIPEDVPVDKAYG